MNNIIIVDTREKGHKKILEHFDKVEQDYIVSKLDYKLFNYFLVAICKFNFHFIMI